MDRGDSAIRNCALAPRVQQCLQHFFVTENGLDKELVEESAVLLLAEIPEAEACNAIAEFVERFKIAKHKIRKSKPGYFRGVCQKFWKLNRQRHKVRLIAQARMNARLGHRSSPRGETLSPLVQHTLALLFTRGSGLDMCLIDECVRRRLGALPEEDAIEVLFDFCCATMYRQSHIRNLNAYLMTIITRHKERSKFAAKACDQNSLVAAMAAMNLGVQQYPATVPTVPMRMPVTTPMYPYPQYSTPYSYSYSRPTPSFPQAYQSYPYHMVPMSSVPVTPMAAMPTSVPVAAFPQGVPNPPESLTAQVSLTRSTTPSSRTPSDSSGDSPRLMPHTGVRQITPPAVPFVTELYPSPLNVAGVPNMMPHMAAATTTTAAPPMGVPVPVSMPVRMPTALPVQMTRAMSLPLSLSTTMTQGVPHLTPPTVNVPLSMPSPQTPQQFHFPVATPPHHG